jgi:hypothetical protein
MSAVRSVVIAGIGYLVWRDRKASALLGAVVFSHWVMDFLMHDNLPLFFNGIRRLGWGWRIPVRDSWPLPCLT